ncbi:MAG: polyribonucleotide nucleotidyltransferase [Anaerolineae bacterium]|nr:polyribonucleotide nucleotidyltransferase [Anaerolineae bacterium]
MTTHSFTATLGEQTLSFETGKLAPQAGGAVTIQSGDTKLLVTATMSRDVREGISFFPLTVDFEERLYAAGRIPGSFFRREGRPPESATLIARLTDRPLRPLFPKKMRNDVQVIITPLSQDEEHSSDILSIIGASAALTISDVPFDGPIGAARVGYIDGELVMNPTLIQMEESLLDLKLAGSSDALLMVEASAEGVSESVLVEALASGYDAIQDTINTQHEMREAVGKPKRPYTLHGVVPDDLVDTMRHEASDRIADTFYGAEDKEERDSRVRALQNEMVERFGETWDANVVKEALDKIAREIIRGRTIYDNWRPDGRKSDEIRSLSAEVGLLPRAHGSGLFTRGETQVLSVATLGTPREEQIIDDLSPREKKRYMHHYNFPPFSTGETWPLRGPKRREIGHGVLGEHALRPVLPDEDDFAYTIRVVSDVLSSNGSTSQASICGSTLALMDAGVPIKAPVAGIAMGMMKDGDRYQILTDIQGLEDHIGDMDFKVAGTREGVTALQMDIKLGGISYQLLEEALGQARDARLQILDVMTEAIPEPRADFSPYAPRMTIMHVSPDKLGAVIGSGGETVRSIEDQCDVSVDIEDDGTIYVAATSGPCAEKAQAMIEALTEEPEVGQIYTGRVARITNFGAFVEILPNTDGMVHISQLSNDFVDSVEDVVQVGDEIMVMVTNIDREGKIRLSRQAVLEGWTPEEARAADRPGGGRSRR